MTHSSLAQEKLSIVAELEHLNHVVTQLVQGMNDMSARSQNIDADIVR